MSAQDDLDTLRRISQPGRCGVSANAIETLGQAVARANRADQTTRKSDRSTLFTQRALALAAVEALLEAAKRLGYAEFERADEVLVQKDDFATLAAAVRRVESGQ